ncbi:Triosephosphate isomerase [Nymphon striatum]|nr:Triosephosphate isomerase [Nymphon striatum]
MNGSIGLINDFKTHCATFDSAAVEVVVCPPFPLLTNARQSFGQTLRIGAQDCSTQENGARTGDVSAALLAEAGTQYCIIGHSERRMGHGETASLISDKYRQLIANKIQPIFCIGETEAERRKGHWKQALNAQLQSLIGTFRRPLLIAYEPVWAIGSGLVPTSNLIVETICHIQRFVTDQMNMPNSARVLYGGSADETSAARLTSLDGVAGLLVGGASLDACRFGKIISAVADTNWDVLRD